MWVHVFIMVFLVAWVGSWVCPKSYQGCCGGVCLQLCSHALCTSVQWDHSNLDVWLWSKFQINQASTLEKHAASQPPPPQVTTATHCQSIEVLESTKITDHMLFGSLSPTPMCDTGGFADLFSWSIIKKIFGNLSNCPMMCWTADCRTFTEWTGNFISIY